MTIREFLENKENQRRYGRHLEGCSKNWEVYHYNNIKEYIEILKDNNYTPEEIDEQIHYINCEKIEPCDGSEDFIEVIF